MKVRFSEEKCADGTYQVMHVEFPIDWYDHITDEQREWTMRFINHAERVFNVELTLADPVEG